VSADRRPAGAQHRQPDATALAAGLIAVAEDLAGEFSLRPLLERILLRCTELLGCGAGSICSVDEAAGTYRKEADIGVACQSGRVFPLTEGMTGLVVARRAPLWFDRYDQVKGGHVAPEERAALRGVIGMPLEWRGRVIGACIVFSRDERRVFGPDDAELLGLFARHAAIALATARMHEEAAEQARADAAADERDRLLAEVHDSLARSQLRQASTEARNALAEARLILLGLATSPVNGQTLDAALRSEAAWAETAGGLEVRFVMAGTPTSTDERLSHEVLLVAREALTNIVRHAQARSVRVGLLYEPESAILLVQDDGQGFDPTADRQDDGFGLRAVSERARRLGATIDVDSLAGWGTRIRARFPYRRDEEPAGPRPRRLRVGDEQALVPLTEREREVRGRMEQGLPDKLIAERLVLSIKTVEKHAGAVLRKTGARNRTELAARANHARTSTGG